MKLRRPERARKPKTIWEQKGAPSAAKDPKITETAAHTVEKTALKSLATGPLPAELNLNERALPDLLDYISLLKL